MLIGFHGFWNYSFSFLFFNDISFKVPVVLSGNASSDPSLPRLLLARLPLKNAYLITSPHPYPPSLKSLTAVPLLLGWNQRSWTWPPVPWPPLSQPPCLTLCHQTTLDVRVVLCVPFHWTACPFSDPRDRMWLSFLLPPCLTLNSVNLQLICHLSRDVFLALLCVVKFPYYIHTSPLCISP